MQIKHLLTWKIKLYVNLQLHWITKSLNWLRKNHRQVEMQGYVLQPYSAASITLVDAATSHLPADTLSKFKNLFIKTGPEVLKRQFNLQDSEKPIWLFRVGRK